MFEELKIKDSLIVGAILSVPVLVTYFSIKMIIGLMNFWGEEVFVRLSIEKYYLGIIGPILTGLVIYFAGRVIISDLFDKTAGKIMKRLPLIAGIWLTIKRMSKRIRLIAKGGYKRVVYEQYGKGSKRWKPAFVIGKTTFTEKIAVKSDKKERMVKRIMLVISTPNFSFPDSVWVPPEETKIVSGGISGIGFFILSGGLVNPDNLDLEEWTGEKLENEIPEYDKDED